MKNGKHWHSIVIAMMLIGAASGRGQIDYGLVADIHLSITDVAGTVIKQGGPWAYNPNEQFFLPGVPAGPDRTISMWTTDASGLPTYTGQIAHVDIQDEDPVSKSTTIVVRTETNRLALYYYESGTEVTGIVAGEVTGIVLEPLVETTLEVTIDIKPGSERNTLSCRSKGQLHVAILGSDQVDVTLIDPSSVVLAGARATKHWLKHVSNAQPEAEADGILDLVVAFDVAAVRATMESPVKGSIIPLALEGVLLDGTAIAGRDTVTIVGQVAKPKKPKKPKAPGKRKI